MNKPKRIKSTFAIVDVCFGRDKLEKYVRGHDNKNEVEVVLKGRINDLWSVGDDISSEFEMVVDSIEIVDKPEGKKV